MLGREWWRHGRSWDWRSGLGLDYKECGTPKASRQLWWEQGGDSEGF